ncbi:PBAN-type neuropeptides-like [Cotesia glomerata]|uniref:Uncharacterized protein n=1 Tax=Cotesia glomerata TaxID=32391 RepID=A0AAV7IV70_COTGL|nr:PBAN-type neuropeptides-like [Cotesia glomerata]KAH0558246.1 hypothetical protein KQX54_015167 [Cotesia glomerata]
MSSLRLNVSFGAGILLLIIIVNQVSCDDGNNLVKNGESGSQCAEQKDCLLLWFGPRLGRRRRSGAVSQVNDDINTITDVINANPWAFASYHGTGDKRHSTQFTPRLGRELEDTLVQRYLTLDKDNDLYHLMDGQNVDQNRQLSLPPPPLFAPRLGRQLPLNSPRLRQLLQNLRNF